MEGGIRVHIVDENSCTGDHQVLSSLVRLSRMDWLAWRRAWSRPCGAACAMGGMALRGPRAEADILMAASPVES